MGNGVCWTPDERATDKVGSVRKTRAQESIIGTVGDDTKTGVTALGMEDMRVKAYLTQNSARIASWTQMREEILEITRTQQYNDSQLVPGVRLRNKGKGKGKVSKSKGKGQDSRDKGKSNEKDTKNESSKKSGRDDKKRCYYCQETGHVWSQCGSRLKDLTGAEERSLIANSHPNDTATIVLMHCSLSDEYAMTFPMALPSGRRKPSCERNNVDTTLRSDVGSTAPSKTERVKLTLTVQTCGTLRMWDTCAGGGICSREPDQTAQSDTTVETVQLVTALDEPALKNVARHILV